MAAGLASVAEMFLSQFGCRTVFIYIEEAHADNEWPIATPEIYAVPQQHKSMEDRVSCVQRLRDVLPALAPMRFYCDSMDNKFQTIYGAWPTRLFLFAGPELVVKVTASSMAHIELGEFVENAVEALQQRM